MTPLKQLTESVFWISSKLRYKSIKSILSNSICIFLLIRYGIKIYFSTMITMQLDIFFLYILCHTYSTLYMIQPETMKHEFAKTLRTAHTDSLTDKKPRKTQVYKCETGRKQLWQYQTNKNKIRRERMVDEQRKRGNRQQERERERERGNTGGNLRSSITLLLSQSHLLPLLFLGRCSGRENESRDVMLAEGSVITLADWVLHHMKTVETISNIQ